MLAILRYLTDFKLLTKLVLGFGTVALVAGASGWLLLSRLGQLEELSGQLGRRDVQRIFAYRTSALREHFLGLESALVGTANTPA